MIHTREEVIERTVREFEKLDSLVSGLSADQWALPVPRSETKEPWTVKDALAHITHWKADVARSVRRQRKPLEERGLNITDGNHYVYMLWRDRSPQEVLAWHRQVHMDVLEALRQAPESWFNARDRQPAWPYDLDGHSADHRMRDIMKVLGRS